VYSAKIDNGMHNHNTPVRESTKQLKHSFYRCHHAYRAICAVLRPLRTRCTERTIEPRQLCRPSTCFCRHQVQRSFDVLIPSLLVLAESHSLSIAATAGASNDHQRTKASRGTRGFFQNRIGMTG